MTLKYHQFAGVFAWLISLLLLSPAMVWSLPGLECNTESDPTEGSQVEIDEVTLSESHSTQRQTRCTRPEFGEFFASPVSVRRIRKPGPSLDGPQGKFRCRDAAVC